MDDKECTRKALDGLRLELEKMITLETQLDKETIINMSQELDELIIQYIKLNNK